MRELNNFYDCLVRVGDLVEWAIWIAGAVWVFAIVLSLIGMASTGRVRERELRRSARDWR
ncbi:MAG TPA: hypothetical protein VNL14_16510 [Candidatus Acidoferrales bacterium]|nr:hypothetical protein [Candidatus Acidoferrales bacterium]